MKKVLFCVLIVVLLLVSCETTNSYSYSGYNTSNYSNNGHNTYTVRTFSSNHNFSNKPFSKGNVVLVSGDTNDYSFNRPLEIQLSEYLERIGLKTYLSTDYDYYNTDGSFNSEKYNTMLKTINPDFSIHVSVEPNSLYTYELGGGISQMVVSTDIINFHGILGSTIEMTSTVEGYNNFEKYYSSMDTVITYLVESIGNEIMKYVK